MLICGADLQSAQQLVVADGTREGEVGEESLTTMVQLGRGVVCLRKLKGLVSCRDHL